MSSSKKGKPMKTKKPKSFNKIQNEIAGQHDKVIIHFNCYVLRHAFSDHVEMENEAINDLRLRLGDDYCNKYLWYKGNDGDGDSYFTMEWEGSARALKKVCDFFVKSKKWAISEIHNVKDYVTIV